MKSSDSEDNVDSDDEVSFIWYKQWLTIDVKFVIEIFL